MSRPPTFSPWRLAAKAREEFGDLRIYFEGPTEQLKAMTDQLAALAAKVDALQTAAAPPPPPAAVAQPNFTNSPDSLTSTRISLPFAFFPCTS